jgi:hypothetical protein
MKSFPAIRYLQRAFEPAEDLRYAGVVGDAGDYELRTVGDGARVRGGLQAAFGERADGERVLVPAEHVEALLRQAACDGGTHASEANDADVQGCAFRPLRSTLGVTSILFFIVNVKIATSSMRVVPRGHMRL